MEAGSRLLGSWFRFYIKTLLLVTMVGGTLCKGGGTYKSPPEMGGLKSAKISRGPLNFDRKAVFQQCSFAVSRVNQSLIRRQPPPRGYHPQGVPPWGVVTSLHRGWVLSCWGVPHGTQEVRGRALPSRGGQGHNSQNTIFYKITCIL